MSNASKIVFITGGSRGLGRDMALACAKSGRDVIITFRSNEAEAQKVVEQIRQLGPKAAALRLDVGNTPSLDSFVQQLAVVLRRDFDRATIDFLVNNAGHGAHATIAETTEDTFDHLMQVHLKGAFFLTQRLLPLISDGGRIVNVSSGLTRFTIPGYGAYAAMKGALEVLTRYLAKELGARAISVNTVAPGAIETDFGGGAVRDNADLNQYVASQTALGRVGRPQDIGGVVASLLRDDSRWINAQRLEISGGMFL